MSILEFQGIADIIDEFGTPRSTIPSKGGRAPRWCRLREQYYRPSLKFCSNCVESALWSRNRCTYCGGELHPMTLENKQQLDEKKAQLAQHRVVGGFIAVLTEVAQQDA